MTRVLLVLGLVLPLVGCGYEAGGPYRRDVRTVYVDMIDTKEFRRDIEFALTEAVKKRIATDTPYRLAERPQADTVLKAEVLEVRQAAFAPEPRSRLPREKQMTLAVRVEWKDMRTGRLLIDMPVLLTTVDYVPPLGESELFGQDKVVERAAQRIVARMYDDDW